MTLKVYEMVTERIIEQLEKGVIPWRKTWRGSEPINYVSRKRYNGINLMLLPFGGEWLTFKQAKDSGGTVKRGEKSSMIVFYKTMERENDEGEKEIFPFLQYSNLFHLSQCENIESRLEPIICNPDIEPIQAAQNILDGYISRSGVTVSHVKGGTRASYNPVSDTITLPEMGQFESAEEYYSTAYHEASHSSGHKSRLNRDIGTSKFGSVNYSREELIAEIAACILMNAAGIERPYTFENSAAYIKNWIGVLKEDAKAIVSASGKASKAADLILGVSL